MKVTVTFDNGPSDATADVLDVLADYGIRSTFFVVGTQLTEPGARALVERADAEGHWIGNHTLTHSVQFGDSDDSALPAREVGENEELIADLPTPTSCFGLPPAGGFSIDDCSATRRSTICKRTDTRVCCGIACLTTGISPTRGFSGRYRKSAHSHGACWSSTTCQPVRCHTCPNSSTASTDSALRSSSHFPTLACRFATPCAPPRSNTSPEPDPMPRAGHRESRGRWRRGGRSGGG